jgi:hypothetical protein
VLFFLKPDTFPAINFDTTILASLHKTIKAGILENTQSGGLLNRLKLLLPLRCVLCFIKADNFFISRHLFHLKTKFTPRKEVGSFAGLIEFYALAFRAKLV